MSKEAVNNVGIFVSEKKVQKSDDGSLDFTPQITAHENAIVKNMDGWEHLCGMYTAKGGEEYIVVGCFGAEDAMVREKVKKPAGVTGTPFNGAYYYIDNIDIVDSVFVTLDEINNCWCRRAGHSISLIPAAGAGFALCRPS